MRLTVTIHCESTEMFIVNAVKSAFVELQTWNAKRSTRAQLLRLSDHELEDIGFNRGDIDQL